MTKKALNRLVACTIGAIAMATVAAAESPVKAGSLSCSVSDSEGSIVSKKITLACEHVDVDGNSAGNYEAQLDRAGLSLGTVEAAKIDWIVLTVGDPENVDLEGTYIGASAGASAGAGIGANWLTGGFNGKISLQPFSVEGKSGIGLELGGQKLVLTKAAES